MQKLISNDLHTFIASHYFSSNDIGVNEEVSNEYIPDDDRDAGGLPYCIQLSIGTRVMLIRNLNVEYGLVNGAIGEVTHIHTNETASNSFITVRFPHVNLPSCLSDVPHHVSIEKFNQEYLYKGRFIVRQNFPVITCWATTIHKVQGLSLKSAAIAIGNSVFQHGQAYVALSRVEKFENLYLLSFSEQSLSCDAQVINEYLTLSLRNGFILSFPTYYIMFICSSVVFTLSYLQF